jgi:hypothetical protein
MGKKGYECKGTWETIQLYTKRQIKVMEAGTAHFYCWSTCNSFDVI